MWSVPDNFLGRLIVANFSRASRKSANVPSRSAIIALLLSDANFLRSVIRDGDFERKLTFRRQVSRGKYFAIHATFCWNIDYHEYVIINYYISRNLTIQLHKFCRRILTRYIVIFHTLRLSDSTFFHPSFFIVNLLPFMFVADSRQVLVLLIGQRYSMLKLDNWCK